MNRLQATSSELGPIPVQVGVPPRVTFFGEATIWLILVLFPASTQIN